MVVFYISFVIIIINYLHEIIIINYLHEIRGHAGNCTELVGYMAVCDGHYNIYSELYNYY